MLKENYPIIGLTGSFGSGCTTFATVLHQDFKMSIIKFSTFIRAEAERQSKTNLTRQDLQDIGDELRQKKSIDYWADLAYLELEKQDTQVGWVVDGFRNLGEVAYFRHRPRFVLVAVDCQPSFKRFNRIAVNLAKEGKTYEGGEKQFSIDDERDRDDDKPYGQQVARCVDDADILLINDEDLPKEKRDKVIRGKLDPYVNLIKGELSEPTASEKFMNAAYVFAEASTCMRRQVGAVITRGEPAQVVAASYNENPPPLRACRIEFKRDAADFDGCYRDQKRFEDIQKVIPFLEKGECPKCRTDLQGLASATLHCPNCHKNLYKEFFGGRGMEHCTALHAEERAILHAKSDLRGCTIYCTTFPCFLCSKKILEVGIKKVMYVDPYPSPDADLSISLFQRYGVAVERFEGVKGRAYHVLFRDWEKSHIKIS